jgi:hypothetical protein
MTSDNYCFWESCAREESQSCLGCLVEISLPKVIRLIGLIRTGNASTQHLVDHLHLQFYYSHLRMLFNKGSFYFKVNDVSGLVDTFNGRERN